MKEIILHNLHMLFMKFIHKFARINDFNVQLYKLANLQQVKDLKNFG